MTIGPPPDEDEPGAAGGAPAWMATMADMFSLLLTFFVLLLSFANMDVVKFRMMLGSVKDAFGVQEEHAGDIEARATSAIQLSNLESTPYLEPPAEGDGGGEYADRLIGDIGGNDAHVALEFSEGLADSLILQVDQS